MKMTIDSWFKSQGKLVRFQHSPVSMGESGYASVEEMRKELRRRWASYCEMTDITNGVRIVDARNLSFHTQEVTLAD
jgi:hypothetical protein